MARPWALAAALGALALLAPGELNLAAFGGRSKVKLRRKAPPDLNDLKAPQVPPRSKAKLKAPDLEEDLEILAQAPEPAPRSLTPPSLKTAKVKAPADLGKDFKLLAEALPRKEDRQKKNQIWEKLQMICEEALNDDVQVWPFGSSANGCGEATADLDMVISDVNKPSKSRAVKILRKIVTIGKKYGFMVVELRPFAKVPILMLRRDGIDVDVSCGNLLPLLNSRLLRSYTLLNKRLSLVALAVKRWAKARGIAKTFDGFISSYAWTLMVVYYMQINGQLPSLHCLMEEKYGGMGYMAPQKGYAWDFIALDLARQIWPGPKKTMSCGELFQGFFSFYANDFEWHSEVVSVRRGQRDMVSSRGHYKHLGGQKKQASKRFNIEDPIDIQRNLNFALKKSGGLDTLRYEIDTAHDVLREGLGLSALDIELPRPRKKGKQPWKQRIQENYLELPDDPANSVIARCKGCGNSMSLAALLDHSSSCEVKPKLTRSGEFCCEMCLKCFAGLADLKQHQNSTGHLGQISRKEALALLNEGGQPPFQGSRRRTADFWTEMGEIRRALG